MLLFTNFQGLLKKGEEKQAGRPLTFYTHLNNCESALETENQRSSQNFQGFMNLMILILFFSQFRLIYENYLKYGIVISPGNIKQFFSNSNNSLYFFCSGFIIVFCIIFCFIIEKILSKFNNRKLYILHIINLLFLLIGPLIPHHWGIVSPLAGIASLTCISIIFLKLCSYIHFWNDVRVFIENKDKFMKSDDTNLHSELYKEVILIAH